MLDNETFLSELVNTMRQGQHQKFQFLTSWYEYVGARKYRKSYKLLLASIRQGANKLLKKYCRSITVGETSVSNMFAYRIMLDLLEFYSIELRILEDMIEEYEAYLANGNWLDFVLGTQRSWDKLYDHREN